MRIGLLALTHGPLAGLGKLAAIAEVVGYDTLWLADERFFREVYVSLAHCARHTTRIRLGPCVTDPYSRHPALTAMAVATLAEACGGRVSLGIGAGISGFTELGITRIKPARAIREAVEVIRRLLAGEAVDHRGEVIRLGNARLGFVPDPPSIPIYVASNGPLGQRAAGAVGDAAIMEGCATVDEVHAFAQEVGRGARDAGRDPARVTLVARLNACIAPDGRAARDVLRPHVARTLAAGRLRYATLQGQGVALPPEAKASVAHVGYEPGVTPYLHLLPLVPDHFVDALSLAGTAEEVTERVVALGRAGIGEIILHPVGSTESEIEETIRSFAEAVAPAARRALDGT
ncbi:MAG: LLM class flavin-dependent oxidoreductase [Candidatus Rokuibacteriota bacterium]